MKLILKLMTLLVCLSFSTTFAQSKLGYVTVNESDTTNCGGQPSATFGIISTTVYCEGSDFPTALLSTAYASGSSVVNSGVPTKIDIITQDDANILTNPSGLKNAYSMLSNVNVLMIVSKTVGSLDMFGGYDSFNIRKDSASENYILIGENSNSEPLAKINSQKGFYYDGVNFTIDSIFFSSPITIQNNPNGYISVFSTTSDRYGLTRNVNLFSVRTSKETDIVTSNSWSHTLHSSFYIENSYIEGGILNNWDMNTGSSITTVTIDKSVIRPRYAFGINVVKLTNSIFDGGGNSFYNSTLWVYPRPSGRI